MTQISTNIHHNRDFLHDSKATTFSWNSIPEIVSQPPKITSTNVICLNFWGFRSLKQHQNSKHQSKKPDSVVFHSLRHLAVQFYVSNFYDHLWVSLHPQLRLFFKISRCNISFRDNLEGRHASVCDVSRLTKPLI